MVLFIDMAVTIWQLPHSSVFFTSRQIWANLVDSLFILCLKQFFFFLPKFLILLLFFPFNDLSSRKHSCLFCFIWSGPIKKSALAWSERPWTGLMEDSREHNSYHLTFECMALFWTCFLNARTASSLSCAHCFKVSSTVCCVSALTNFIFLLKN